MVDHIKSGNILKKNIRGDVQLMKKLLRTITIIEGSIASGKSRELFRLYRETAQKTKSIFLSYEDRMGERIPAEEMNASIGYYDVPKDDIVETLDDYINYLTPIIKRDNIEHVFIDSLSVYLQCPYNSIELYTALHRLPCSVTASIQLRRDTHVNIVKK